MTARERLAAYADTSEESERLLDWDDAIAAEAVAARDAVWREAIEKLCWPEHAGLILAEVERRTGATP